jgi:alkanesulfonate monooxygenase SsuD/methylene tetrahydromethanopterin reductase-like flavin-dependent oxidoreductase (luciferase family)
MTQFWRMGATPVPATEIGRLARTFEASGWDGLALGEAHGLLPDPYVLLGIAAVATTTLKLGTSVAVPLRHPLLDFSVGADTKRLRECIALAHDACEAAGRDPASLRLGCYLQIAVADGHDDAAEAVRGLIVTHARFSGNFSSRAAAVMETVLTAPRGGVTCTGRPGELAFYPKDALDEESAQRFGIIGPAEHCVERLEEILDLGLANVYVGTRSVGVDLDEENALRIGREVLGRIR